QPILAFIQNREEIVTSDNLQRRVAVGIGVCADIIRERRNRTCLGFQQASECDQSKKQKRHMRNTLGSQSVVSFLLNCVKRGIEAHSLHPKDILVGIPLPKARCSRVGSGTAGLSFASGWMVCNPEA